MKKLFLLAIQLLTWLFDSVDESETLKTEVLAVSSLTTCLLLGCAAAPMRAGFVPDAKRQLLCGHMLLFVRTQSEKSILARPLGALAVVFVAWYYWLTSGVAVVFKTVRNRLRRK